MELTNTIERRSARQAKAAEPRLAGEKTRTETYLVKLFAVVPFAWGWGLDWTDIVLTVGFHRCFTHGAFEARRGLRIALAVTGSMAMQGPVIGWVADHRRRHAYADRDGDPHSPWRYGTSVAALAKGFRHAHMGWLFDRDKTNAQRFAPDLPADRDIVRIDRWFPALTVATLQLKPAAGGGHVDRAGGRTPATPASRSPTRSRRCGTGQVERISYPSAAGRSPTANSWWKATSCGWKGFTPCRRTPWPSSARNNDA